MELLPPFLRGELTVALIVPLRRARAVPTSEVVDYDALIDAMTCHPKDRHVLAAAVAGGAQVVATFNVKDFPLASVEPHDIGVVHPGRLPS